MYDAWFFICKMLCERGMLGEFRNVYLAKKRFNKAQMAFFEKLAGDHQIVIFKITCALREGKDSWYRSRDSPEMHVYHGMVVDLLENVLKYTTNGMAFAYHNVERYRPPGAFWKYFEKSECKRWFWLKWIGKHRRSLLKNTF